MYDYFNPFMSAALVTDPKHRTQTRYPLWSCHGAESDGKLTRIAGLPDGLTSLAFLEELTIQLQLAQLPVITAQLSPPFDDARALLDSPLVEWGHSQFECVFGYVGGEAGGTVLSPVYSGIVLKPDIQLGTDVSITLHAQGLGYNMTTAEGGLTLPGATRLEAIERLVQGPDPLNKRPLKLDTSEVTEAADAEAYRLLKVVPVNIVQGFKSDWFFMWNLVQQSRCWMYLLNDTIKIIPVAGARSKTPKIKLALFDYPEGKVGPSVGLYPILSASTPNMAIYMSGASTRGFVNYSTSSKTRETVVTRVNDKTAPVARTGQAQAQPRPSGEHPDANPTTGEGATFFPANPDFPDAEAQMKAEFALATSNMGVKLEIETLGVPDLFPGDMVEVTGLGKRLDASYSVFSLTHTFGGGGSSTSLELVSNVSSLYDKFDSMYGPTGPANTKSAPDARGDGKIAKTPKDGA